MSLVTVNISFNEGCIESERQALFMFKQDLINHANRLASWTVDKDCCDWVGVVCDNVTGHVLQLHLTNPLSSPGNLYARDADYEAFERLSLCCQSPMVVWSFLELYLSGCQLPQVPPPENLNLSSLTILDLSSNSLENTLVDFSWIFQLKSLVSLDLSGNNFQGCVFDGLENMTSLTHLDLSDNSFNSSIPDWLYKLNSLQFLSLRFNYLQGLISSAVGNMSSAISLDFSGNELEGKIPRSMGNLCNLKSIDYSVGVNFLVN
ncbi:hypothetical protein SCA6_015994 [Theobroma cacao]